MRDSEATDRPQGSSGSRAFFPANTDIEHLDRNNFSKAITELYIKGRGLFIEALEEELQKKNLSVKILEQDCITEMRGEKTPIHLH